MEKQPLPIYALAITMKGMLIEKVAFRFTIYVSLIVNDSITEKIDNESFYAGYNAYSAKEWVLNNNGLIMHEQVVIDALNMLDESDRTVISFGKPIKYFYWYKNDEVPNVHVKYKNTKLKDEIYIYI